MAIIQFNAFTKGVSGGLGRIVFRQLRGKTVMASKPDRVKKQSAQQRENRIRFKCASAWAKAQMLDPEKKAYYWRKAKKLKLPNAYTAAIGDYMRKADIKQIDVSQYKGKAGDGIKLKVQKKDFTVNKVEVTLFNAAGQVIERGMSTKKDHDVFFYKVQQTLQEKLPITVRIVVCEHGRNEVRREVVVSGSRFKVPG